MSILEQRAKNRYSDAYIEENVAGKLMHPDDISMLLRGGQPIKVVQPDGKPLCIYLPAAVQAEFAEVYGTLQQIRGVTDNRGYASGTERVKKNSRGTRTRTKNVMSSILGSFDPYGGDKFCRLTSYNANYMAEFQTLLPLFQAMAHQFGEYVPERYAAQAGYVNETPDDWVIPGTPYTTITVNSTYPTGVHTDKGDLDEGFSCLAVGRRGDFTGGWLTFPAYGLAVDLQDGDLLLMDAHEWHGNTDIKCPHCDASLDRPGHVCGVVNEVKPYKETGVPRPRQKAYDQDGPERISVVAYYRTNMKQCGSLAEEDAKRAAVAERQTERALGLA